MIDEERAVVERQIGRPPRAFRRVVVRCPYGNPAVTEQWPFDEAGEPFPTTYYLTCGHLVAAVSRLEAAGGVARWSEAARDDPELRASLERATARQRELRRALASGRPGRCPGSSIELGIGGAARPERLKCLHAHVAFALAQPDYLLGRRILAELAEGQTPAGLEPERGQSGVRHGARHSARVGSEYCEPGLGGPLWPEDGCCSA